MDVCEVIAYTITCGLAQFVIDHFERIPIRSRILNEEGISIADGLHERGKSRI